MSSEGHRLLAAASSGSVEAARSLLTAASDAAQLLQDSKDARGCTPLHLAAAGGHESVVEALLEHVQADEGLLARDSSGAVPLHGAAQSAVPMCAFQLASRAPGACLEPDSLGQTPIDLATASEKGELLNAMLLACAGHGSGDSLASMRALLGAGAVCDTWAPNGSSALMLAASADCAEGVGLLLDSAASLELQDALGRTALMFAAGNNARRALETLLDRGASVSIRDRRGRNVLEYAAAGSEVRAVLEARIAEMEARAAALQEALLAELSDGSDVVARSGKKSKKKKKGQQSRVKAASAALAVPAAAVAAKPAAAEPAVAEMLLAEEHRPQLQPRPPAAPQQPAEQPAEQPAQPIAPAAGDGAELSSDGRPGSPEWRVVGRRKREEGGQLHSLSQRHLDPSPGPSMRRCPSASSLGSSCSGESHDTAGSSQRSVLIPPSRSSSAARNHLATKAAAAAAAGAEPGAAVAALAKPAWGRPASGCGPATQQLGVSPINDESAYPPLPAAVQQQQLPEPEQPPQQQQQLHEEAGQQQQQASNGDGCTEPGTPPAAAATAAAAASTSAGSSSPSAALPADLPGSTATEEPEAAAHAAEVAALLAEVAALRLQQERSEAVHRIELASVLEDTAAHEAAAVAEAVAAERMNCIYRFAAFLQNNHLVAAELLASYGMLASAQDFPGAPPPRPQPALTPGLDFPGLGFPPIEARRLAGSASAKSGPQATSLGSLPTVPGGGSAAAPAAAAPLPAPFFADLEQRLRTEYSGDKSHFVVPASEAEAAVPPPLPMALF